MDPVEEPLAASRDAQPSPWVSVFGVANTIWASIDFIISPVIFLAKILLSLVTTLLTPIVHLGRLAMYLALLPVRILAKFESLFIFLGWAILVGGLAGLLLHVIDRSIGRAFQLSGPFHDRQERRKPIDDFAAPRSFPSKVDVGEHMASVPPRSTRQMLSQGLSSGRYDNDSTFNDFYAEWMRDKERTLNTDSGLFSTTILEEEDDNTDSDDY